MEENNEMMVVVFRQRREIALLKKEIESLNKKLKIKKNKNGKS
jgi:hypothetical protein